MLPSDSEWASGVRWDGMEQTGCGGGVDEDERERERERCGVFSAVWSSTIPGTALSHFSYSVIMFKGV